MRHFTAWVYDFGMRREYEQYIAEVPMTTTSVETPQTRQRVLNVGKAGEIQGCGLKPEHASVKAVLHTGRGVFSISVRKDFTRVGRMALWRACLLLEGCTTRMSYSILAFSGS